MPGSAWQNANGIFSSAGYILTTWPVTNIATSAVRLYITWLNYFVKTDINIQGGIIKINIASTRLVHLDVEDWSEELLRQQSYAIKNQLGHQKPPTRGFGTQIPLFIGLGGICLLLAGSLWHKTAGASITKRKPRHSSTNESGPHLCW